MIWHLALQNAFEHEGKGAVGSVIGRIMVLGKTCVNLEDKLGPFASLCKSANKLAQDEGLAHIEILANEAPHLLEGRRNKEEKVCLNSRMSMASNLYSDSHRIQTVTLLWTCTRCCHQRNLFQRT